MREEDLAAPMTLSPENLAALEAQVQRSNPKRLDFDAQSDGLHSDRSVWVRKFLGIPDRDYDARTEMSAAGSAGGT